MKWFKTLWILSTVSVVLSAFALGCGPAADSRERPVDTSADEAAILDLITQAEVANNAADTLGWVALFSSDAVYMAPGMQEVTSREGLIQVAETGFGRYSVQISTEPKEIVVMGDWAFARSRVTGTANPRAGGEQSAIDVKQLVVYQRTEDGWKIARMMNNSNP